MARKPNIIPNYTSIADKMYGEQLKGLMKYIADHWERFSEMQYSREHDGAFWGKVMYGRIYILASEWNRICKDIGVPNGRALLQWLKYKGYIVADSEGNPTSTVRVNGKVSRCVALEVRKISAAAA